MRGKATSRDVIELVKEFGASGRSIPLIVRATGLPRSTVRGLFRVMEKNSGSPTCTTAAVVSRPVTLNASDGMVEQVEKAHAAFGPQPSEDVAHIMDIEHSTPRGNENVAPKITAAATAAKPLPHFETGKSRKFDTAGDRARLHKSRMSTHQPKRFTHRPQRVQVGDDSDKVAQYHFSKVLSRRRDSNGRKEYLVKWKWFVDGEPRKDYRWIRSRTLRRHRAPGRR